VSLNSNDKQYNNDVGGNYGVIFSGVRVTPSLVLCVCFVVRCFPFVLFLLAIMLSVRLRFTDSNYSFGICKLFSYLKMCVKRPVIALDHVFTEFFSLTDEGYSRSMSCVIKQQ
jgi:hypothetical protein